MEADFMTRHPSVKDVLNFLLFVGLVLIGTLLINTFIFRSYSVLGPSMENTLFTGDRLIVNRLPITVAQIENKQYVPNRGQVIVFINPRYVAGSPDEFIVKRVIAFPGERVVVSGGVLTVYNKEHPSGFHPDDSTKGPQSPTSGDVDTIVASGTLFVSGDHRESDFSYDSRSGLGTIPFFDVIGPVALRIWPLTKISTF